MKKILVILNSTDPYWLRFYEKIAPLVSAYVLFLRAPKTNDYSWKKITPNFAHDFLTSKSSSHVAEVAGFLKLRKKIEAFQPEAVICSGYNRLVHLAILVWSRKHGIPVILHGDSNIRSEFSKSFFLKAIKRVYLSLFLKGTKTIWTMGRCNELYWLNYGARAEMLFDGGYCPIDVEHFAQEAAENFPKREFLKKELGIQDKTVFLFVGRIVEIKGWRLLLEAFSRVEKDNAVLLIIGEGPQRKDLEHQVADKKLSNKVILLGPKPHHELPLYYALADAYIQPSLYEPAGLVIHEALACGTPVIASDVCGYGQEMIVRGWNGNLFRTGDASDLESCMKGFLQASEVTMEIRKRAKEMARLWDYNRILSSLENLLTKLTDEKRT